MNIEAPEMSIEDMVNRDVLNLNNTLEHLIKEKFPSIYLVKDQMFFYIHRNEDKAKLGYFKTKKGDITYLNLDDMVLFSEVSNLINFLRVHPFGIFALQLNGYIKQID
ncbi:hypothetical protein vBAbaMD22_91 [Acinetobacter phage vB_AbaM_D22]|nr:hypothetical protein vBAbaMD22_91 [Acinetobacter phage vB_AbaM_D22]